MKTSYAGMLFNENEFLGKLHFHHWFAEFSQNVSFLLEVFSLALINASERIEK